MNDPAIYVAKAKLAQGSADVLKAAKNIETRLNTLETDLTPLKSKWHGNAQLAYDDAKKKWDQATLDMTTLLSQIGNAVDTSNQGYTAADTRGQDRFGRGRSAQ